MSKRAYKEVAIRYYYEHIESYNELYSGVRRLINAGLLSNDWLDYIWNIDKKLYAGELRPAD